MSITCRKFLENIQIGREVPREDEWRVGSGWLCFDELQGHEDIAVARSNHPV